MPDPQAPLPAALAPFAAILAEPRLARTAADTLAWLSERSATDLHAERRLPALVTVACVYARLCAPVGASERHYDVVARFTLLFFLVDDAELSELPDLLAPGASWSIGRHTPALRAWLAEFEEQRLVGAQLRERFALAYHDYLAARRDEHAHHEQPLDLAAHWAFRRRSIFMDPYLDMWMILFGIELEALAQEHFAEARALAVDLVLLANDLASVERDRRGGESPDDLNLLHTYAKQHGVSAEHALESLIAEYNRSVQRYRDALNGALTARPGHHSQRYAEILTGVVEGNVAAVRALPFRYPGAETVLVRLTPVRS
jgi:hypothetical protein